MTTHAAHSAGRALQAAQLADDLIITGEAVALEVRPAAFLLRVVSGLIDAAAYAAVLVALAVGVLGRLADVNEARVSMLSIATIAGIVVVAPTVVETLSRGRSLGKVATGIRIVRDDGGPIRMRHAFIRALTGFGELWLTAGSVAVMTALLNGRGKRLGDLLAGTYAVRTRGADRKAPPLLMPPELEDWARTADIRAMPDGVALAARRFLDRTGTLDPASREQLGRQLAARVEPLVAPPPPWGTHPERFLAAVLVARRDREYAVGLRAREALRATTAELRRLPFQLG
ncbi:RDD family protein [Georgenia satyanarayanai]|uniref:RDD family protein n=1 Tax=Georgenia satyanarayanai TaxID=860221 RepID=UPI00203C5949|nr:RDD family protein [Georgenia satyanarayanai]MCM3661023.1 RDD family protein [Georgenia satyanarayanai]